jgi:CheY-like chemotaxis protein
MMAWMLLGMTAAMVASERGPETALGRTNNKLRLALCRLASLTQRAIAPPPLKYGCPSTSDVCSIEVSSARPHTRDMETINAVDIEATQRIPYASHRCVEDSAILVLVVSSVAQESRLLAQVLGAHGCPRYLASTVREATDWLLGNRARLVICDDRLPDGHWQDLWERLSRLPNPPVFVVSAHSTDARLWAEVLNLGAYDVLVRPYEESEVSRILRQACRTSVHLR